VARLALRALLAGILLVPAPAAGDDLADETALAGRFAPIVRLVKQEEECGPGEPYRPMDVDLLFGDLTVALRGPWNALDLVKIAPSAADLRGQYEYHLDFPGHALSPGCDYERWARRLTRTSAPAVYAHVVSDPSHPEKLTLQYWFFYAFNDFNNLHEGDWEMIQLVFNASSAREALTTVPEDVGYSAHEGAERADWGDEKLEIVEGTHVVVYPAAGSHANKFTAALYLGSTATQGVGCDDTTGPHIELRPVVKTIPGDAQAARTAFPWLSFEGRWGELQEAFFNGPAGPNRSPRWSAPIAWMESWHERSYAVPTGGIFGTRATDFFCEAVGTGSMGLVQFLRGPLATLLVVVSLAGLILFAATRTTWRPVAPLRLARRRSWGQILSAAARMYVNHAGLVLGIGALLIPFGFVTAVVHWLILGGFGLVGWEATGEEAGALALFILMVGTSLTLLGLSLVQAAVACALVEIDQGRPVDPLRAYAIALRRIRPLIGGLAVTTVAWVTLTLTTILIPVAVFLAIRWALFVPAVVLERQSSWGGLQRSAQLVSWRWLWVASLVGVGAVVALAAGPLIGALLIFLTSTPLPLLNFIAGVVYALAMPFVALTTAYVYFDSRVRYELAPKHESGVLPAEVEFG
jgi:hypothetical protein